MTTRDVADQLETMDDTQVSEVLRFLCPRCLDRIAAFAAQDQMERDGIVTQPSLLEAV